MILQPLLHTRPFFLAWLERLWWFLVTRVVGPKWVWGTLPPPPPQILRDQFSLAISEGAHYVHQIATCPQFAPLIFRPSYGPVILRQQWQKLFWFVQTMNQPNFIMGLFSQVLTTQRRNQFTGFFFFVFLESLSPKMKYSLWLYYISNLNGDLLGKYLYGPPLKSSLDPSFDELKTCMILKKRIKIED